MTTERSDQLDSRLNFASLRHIAIFRALQLGDLLCVVPALRALRAAAPQARITLIALPWAASLIQRYPRYVDDLLVFPGFPGMPESVPNLQGLPGFIDKAQSCHFDLAIQLHGSGGLSNPLTQALSAKRNAGFFVPGQYCPDASLFTPWMDREHEVVRYVRLMEFLGARPQGHHLEFPLTDDDWHSLVASCPELPEAGSYICIHPGARLPSRRWPPERFARVADELAARGWKIVLTGSGGEKEIIQAVRGSMQMPSLDLSGRTDLGALAALVSQARLVVCNDTGMSHVAAGLATPTVVVSSGSDPHRWAPLDRQRHHFLHADAPCRPCAHAVCPIGHPCALAVTAEQVLEQAVAMTELAEAERGGQSNSIYPPSSSAVFTSLQGS